MDRIRVVFLAFLTLISITAIGAGVYARRGAFTIASDARESVVLARPALGVTRIPRSDAPPVAITQSSPEPAQNPAPTPEPLPPPEPAVRPVFAEQRQPDDRLPEFVCGANAPATQLALIQIQSSGLDRKHGFRLGIVPFGLAPADTVNEAERAALLKHGELDCLLTSLDSAARYAPGVITAIAAESTHVHQVWARDIDALAGLSGKRIAFEAGGASQALAGAISAALRHHDVTLLPASSLAEALRQFNAGEADAVIGWEPQVLDAAHSGGQPLDETRGLYEHTDVIVVTRNLDAARRDIVQRFHNAWFDAIAAQQIDLNGAARSVATWGHNTWTGLSIADSADDWRARMESVTSADLARNNALFKQPELLSARINRAREDWARFPQVILAPLDFDMVDARYVNAAQSAETREPGAKDGETEALIPPAATTAPGPTPGLSGRVTLDVSPCPRITFDADATGLDPAIQARLDACVLDVLQKSPKLMLVVHGSSAWPGPAGAYTREDVEAAARARANSVIDYLASRGIDRKRFVLRTVLPPPARRGIEDATLQARDRYVDLLLIAPGL